MKDSLHIGRALRRQRTGIALIAVCYAGSAVAGGLMVHGGNGLALRYRDRLVANANEDSPILHALRGGRVLTAAGLDFSANLGGGLASTAAGYWAPAVVPIALYRGWVGGIVSVDEHHRSRLNSLAGGLYYLVTLLLQLTAYVLAGGAGVTLGLARVANTAPYVGPRRFGLPVEALRDALRTYVLVIPLFACASIFEFYGA